MSFTLDYHLQELQFKHPFSVAGNTRNHTPSVLIILKYENFTGYGEVTMPPYLGETPSSAITFLKKVSFSGITTSTAIAEFHHYIDSLDTGNNAAKAGLDIAFHDLLSKRRNVDICSLYSLPNEKKASSFTIGLDTPQVMLEKTSEAEELGFHVLKVKLGGLNDRETMRLISDFWKKPISVDANQGWKDASWSLDFCHELKEMGVLFVEQPFEKNDLKSAEWLTSRSPLPIIADESCKRFSDLDVVKNCFHGINVKLMKSTGLFEAYKMLQFAKNNQMKTVTGCMAESSCAVAAMSHFAALADWVDLDGPFLITNDPFEPVKLIEGCIQVPRKIGIGVELL
ncbi:MAG: hypothetical protein RL037_503 [Bacteroidota bacterium]|jgi:L-alanine-DL-glutamate epimerase-like enolase superfamily enzyme